MRFWPSPWRLPAPWPCLARVPLYQHFADILAGEPAGEHAPLHTLPRPTINLFSGGKHAGAQIPIQDVLVVASSASTIDEALEMTCAVFQAASDLIAEKYGMRVLTADEGGLAPPFAGADAMLQDAVTAIEAAGYAPGSDVALAVDVASSHFYRDGRYHLDGKSLDSAAMRDVVLGWLDRYPIVSIEDGLAEEDWAHWPDLYAGVGERALVLGDDFLCTNPARIRRAIDAQAADALLLKVNQIGTLTEAAEAYRLARERRLDRHHQRAQRRDRRQLAGRSVGGMDRRPDQGRLHHPVGPTGQVQSPADHRSRDGFAHRLLAEPGVGAPRETGTNDMPPIDTRRVNQLADRLPPEWPESLLPTIQAQLAAGDRTLVVLDDDPTGTQTVHDVTVLTEWTCGVAGPRSLPGANRPSSSSPIRAACVGRRAGAQSPRSDAICAKRRASRAAISPSSAAATPRCAATTRARWMRWRRRWSRNSTPR